jgi:uncharacterized lipoprotein YddW (UPF0748 family)
MEALTLPDIQGHWAQACIEQLVQQNIFAGYPDGTFKPEQPITRAEFAVLISRAFTVTDHRPARFFIDVPNNHWAAGAIHQAYRGGWLSGYPRNVFLPSQPMPRVQVLVALAAGLGLLPQLVSTDLLSKYLDDANQVPVYARSGIAAALEYQLVVNYPQQRQLNPRHPATRGDVAAFIHQTLGYQTGRPSIFPPTWIAASDLATTPRPGQELRGTWLTNVDSDVLFSHGNLAAAIERLAECNFNTLYPTVWNRGYTLFPSDVAAQVLGEKQRFVGASEIAMAPDRDMLQECLELGHARGLRVIPWFEYGLFALPGNKLRTKHPDWFTHRYDGSYIDKHNMEWMNPFHPEVRQFLLAIIDELMSRYTVDGFQIDDHLGLPVSFGYDNYTQELYLKETGTLPPPLPNDTQWMRWRADKITQLVEDIGKIVKTRRPNGVFSIAPNPPEFSYDNFLQDWPTWITRAGVDEVVIQTYRWNMPSFLNEIRKPLVQALREQIPVSFGVLAGLKNRPQLLPLLKEQCEAVRQHGYAGMSFFFYETIWQTSGETPEVRQEVIKRLFAKAAERPERKPI